MLAKNRRLNLKTNFRFVASGSSIPSQNFKLFYRQSDNTNPLIGVSISSSQFKHSTLRNKAKRIFYNLANTFYNQLPNNINLVIMPKSQSLESPGLDLEKEFKDAISRIKTN